MRSDAEIVDEVLSGSVESYAELVDRWQKPAVGVAARILHDEHLAEDIAQDAFVRAYEKLGSLRDGKIFGSWLLQICRNGALDELRRRVKRVESCSVDELFGMETAVAEKADHSELLENVLKLPDHEKQVVTLKYFGGHTVRELATITSRSIGTVTKQLSRAHTRLRQQMERGLK